MVWPLSRVKYRMERGSIPVNLCNWAKRQKHGTSKIASVLAGQTKQLFEIWINTVSGLWNKILSTSC